MTVISSCALLWRSYVCATLGGGQCTPELSGNVPLWQQRQLHPPRQRRRTPPRRQWLQHRSQSHCEREARQLRPAQLHRVVRWLLNESLSVLVHGASACNACVNQSAQTAWRSQRGLMYAVGSDAPGCLQQCCSLLPYGRNGRAAALCQNCLVRVSMFVGSRSRVTAVAR